MTPMLTTQDEETSMETSRREYTKEGRDERMQRVKRRRGLDVANLGNKVVELLLGLVVLGGHLLVLGLPLVARGLEGLHLALVVAGLDVGLTEPVEVVLAEVSRACDMCERTCRWSLSGFCRPPQPPPRGAAVFSASSRSGYRAERSHQQRPLRP